MCLALAGASILFVANGRIGLPGPSLDDDTAYHLLRAEALRSARMEKLWGPMAAYGNGYPLGPHSLVATVGTATASPLDLAFTGLLLATVSITALVGSGVIGREALWRRTVVGLVCALGYLLASYYAEGAFKETIMALLVLGFAVHLEQASARWKAVTGIARWWLAAPAVLLAVGGLYTYSYVAVAWFGLTLAVWGAAVALLRPGRVRSWLTARRWTGETSWAAGVVALGVITVLPILGGLIDFFRSSGISASGAFAIPVNNLGNLYHRLSPYEAFGIWTSPDFRLFPANIFHAGELSALAVLVFVYGLIWSLRRGKIVLPAAAAACWLIWWRADNTQSPYVSAKALAITTPVVLAIGMAGLLASRRGPVWTNLLRLAAAAAFCAFAAYSSYQDLRNQPVQAPASGRELAAFAKRIGDSSVLFLGADEYASWQLRPAAVSALFPPEPSVVPVRARSNKPFVLGDQLDFDSVAPTDLDHFSYVVTSSSPYNSQPPPNFRSVETGTLYDLWQRTGPTAQRQVIEPPGAPGAVLNCRSAIGKALHASRGVASIMATPVVVPGPTFLQPGQSAVVQLPLPVGRWEISAQYIGAVNFSLDAQGRRWTMPAYVGRQGPFFAVGTVTGKGRSAPVSLQFHADRPSFLTGSDDNIFSYIPVIAATRVPDSRTLVPLSQACGRYVDWYRLT